MTKVAINTCFGGFGISNKALRRILRNKGIKFEADDQNIYYRKGYLHDQDHVLYPYDFCQDRSDPDLIEAIEYLGEQAFGWCAVLKVVEVPDDVEWHISEYDGLEHVAEDHRTWE